MPELDWKTRALEAVLLFYGAGQWGFAQRQRWHNLTGSHEATTKVLCDTVRNAIVQEDDAMPEPDWKARALALENIVILLQWTSRRYCNGRSTYITKAFNESTRALLALGVALEAPDGTLWARDVMGRAYDGLSDAEAAEGDTP